MPGPVRFSRGITRFSKKDSNPAGETNGIVDLLNAVQRLEVSFLPVSPQSGLGIVGRGLSGDIFQSTADVATSFTFKNGIPSRMPRDDDHVQDWYNLVTQLSVLQHTPIKESPYIIDIVGISWTVDLPATRAWPYFVIPKVNRGSLTEFLFEEDITDGVRYQICTQILEAFALLHNCGVGHGDIKSDNVLVEEDCEGNICCKVADFGACAILGQEHLLEGTFLWRAPELSLRQHRCVTAEEVIRSDLYSIALLISQILIPSSYLDTAGLLLLRRSATTAQNLTSLQREGALTEKLMSTAETGKVSSQNREILELIISEALVSDPSARALNWEKVLALNTDKTPPRGVVVLPPRPPTNLSDFGSPVSCPHATFDLARSLGEYDDFDYVVRANTAEELKFKANSTPCSECGRQYALQLAICYRIGFGVRRDVDVGKFWLAKARKAEAELQSAINELAEQYILTGRLTKQVRDSLGIGVLISTDLTQQYQVQGRILAAEQSVSSEILARESELGDLHFSLSKLKSDLAQIYKAQGRLSEAKKIQKEIVFICAKRYGERHPSVLVAKATLAAILVDEGSLVEAEKIQRDLQPMFEEVLGKEHPETVIAYQNWGATLHSQGRHQEATDKFRQIRAVRAKTLTDDHPLTIRADICLAAALQGQGLLQDADQLMFRIANNSAHSGDAVIEAHVQMNLACLYRDQNRLQEAEQAANCAIKVLRKVVLQDDLMKLNADEVLAVVYGEKREFGKQEALLRSILAAKAGLDQAIPYVSNTRALLASNLLKQGRIDDAVTEAQAILDALKESPAVDPENFLACTEILATAKSQRGEIKEAERLSSEMLAAYVEELGYSHPFTLQARSSLANFYAEQGRFNEAAELQAQNLRTLEANKDCGKSATQKARELALTFREQNRFDEAVELCNKGILWSRQAVGDEHIDTVATYNILAGIYLKCGRFEDADGLFESRIVPYVASTDLEMYVLGSMAELRRAQGRAVESMELSQKALNLSFQRLGERHPTSIKMAGNILGARLGQESLNEELEQEVLANIRLKSEILGSHHFSTIKTMSDLAYAYGEQGRMQDAEMLYNSFEASGGESVKPENALRYATYLAKRADLAFRLTDYEQAEAIEKQALAIRKGLLPSEHPAVLVSTANLASTLNAQGRHAEAEQLLRHVISLREAHLSPDAAPTLAVKSDLAAVLFFQSKLGESEALFSAVVEASQRENVDPALLNKRKAQLLQVREVRKQLQRDAIENNT